MSPCGLIVNDTEDVFKLATGCLSIEIAWVERPEAHAGMFEGCADALQFPVAPTMAPTLMTAALMISAASGPETPPRAKTTGMPTRTRTG